MCVLCCLLSLLGVIGGLLCGVSYCVLLLRVVCCCVLVDVCSFVSVVWYGLLIVGWCVLCVVGDWWLVVACGVLWCVVASCVFLVVVVCC